MAYHDDLLQLAFELVNKRADATQADLRRAVSTAYYAVFHMLVSETTMNWNRDSSRNALGRMFDHGLMKKVSERIADPRQTPFANQDQAVVSTLRLVADSFAQLQDKRHVADYDNGTVWTEVEALEEVNRASDAFAFWSIIRQANIAQEYLVSLLIRPRG